MIPTQIKYRAIVLQISSGFLLLTLLILFFIDIFPERAILLRELFSLIIGKLPQSGILLLVMYLLMSYIAGILLNNSQRLLFKLNLKSNTQKINFCYLLRKKILNFMFGIKNNDRLQILITLNGEGESELYYNNLKQKIEKVWDITLPSPLGYNECKTIFELCRSFIECNRNFEFSEHTEIESQFLSMHFNAKAGLIFFIGFVTSLFELFNSIAKVHMTINKWGYLTWVVISLFFWLLMRDSCKRSINSSKQWVRFIFYAFVNTREKEKTFST
jgi:hypothetical protein